MSRIVKGNGSSFTSPSLGTRRLVKHQVASAFEEAAQVRGLAAAESARILAEAQENARLLESEARARGYEEGVREWTERILELNAARTRQIDESRTQLLALSIKLAEKILGRELATRHDALGDLVLEAMRGLPPQSGKIRIRVRPGDAETLRSQRPRLAEAIGHDEIELVEDATIESGGCVIESPVGIVDARLQTQLRVLERLLLEPRRDTVEPR